MNFTHLFSDCFFVKQLWILISGNVNIVLTTTQGLAGFVKCAVKQVATFHYLLKVLDFVVLSKISRYQMFKLIHIVGATAARFKVPVSKLQRSELF